MITALLVCFWAFVFWRIDHLIPAWRSEDNDGQWWQLATICYAPFFAAGPPRLG